MKQMTTPAPELMPLVRLLPEFAGQDFGDLSVSGAQCDSRQVRAGELFIALPGATTHGLEYVDQVARQRAAGVLVDSTDLAKVPVSNTELPMIAVTDLRTRLADIASRVYGGRITGLTLFGVTGTNGKTSCACLLAAALEDLGTPSGYLGTLGWGRHDHRRALLHTTPDLLCSYRILADLASEGATAVAMEVSSHALAQGRCAGLAFETALLTNLGRDHLDYHGSIGEYAACKRKLFEAPGLRQAVINGDDAFGHELLVGLDEGVKTLEYGLEPVRQLRATNLKYHRRGLSAQVHSPLGGGEMQSQLLGRFNVFNLLAVLGALLLRGIPVQEALASLARLEPIPGRMELLSALGKPTVVIDYAHTPDALEAALHALRAHCERRLVCVFGAGGDRDRGKRPLMGEVVSRLADCSVVTSDNPRGEAPESIIDEVIAGMGNADFTRESNRATAIRAAIAKAAPGDCVLVAGKGHEDYQEISGHRYPFSDLTIAQAALNAFGNCS